MTSQHNDYKYFTENRDTLMREYPSKYIVIKNKKILGAYDNKVDAFTETTLDHEPGSFIIQGTFGEEIDSQVFHSRVITV